MATQPLALLFLALVLCNHEAADAETVQDCCLKTTNKSIPFRVVTSFHIQTAAGGCRIPATIFITKNGLSLCAPPAQKSRWVRKLVNKLKKKEQQKEGKRKRKPEQR